MCLIKERQNFFCDNYIFLCAVLFGLINVDIFLFFHKNAAVGIFLTTCKKELSVLYIYNIVSSTAAFSTVSCCEPYLTF